MGSIGVSILLNPVTAEARRCTHDTWDELSSSAFELLECWISERLETEIEEEVLDLAPDIQSSGCGYPSCREYVPMKGSPLHLPFHFRVHEATTCSVLLHWFCIAIREERGTLRAMIADHGFEPSFPEPEELNDEAIFVPVSGDIVEVCTSEEDGTPVFDTSEHATTFEELPDGEKMMVRRAAEEERCHCSLCRKRSG